MSTHTPGPWAVAEEHCSDGSVGYMSVNPVLAGFGYRGGVCSVHDSEHIEGITKAERDANARLISAAPDMLEALRNARDMIATDRTAFVDLSAVHEMTEGDDPDNFVAYSDGLWLDKDDAEAVRDYDRALEQIDAAMTKATGSSA